MTIYDDSKHPRGQADNAGQYRDKANSGPEAGLAVDADPAQTPDLIADSVIEEDYGDVLADGNYADGLDELIDKGQVHYDEVRSMVVRAAQRAQVSAALSVIN